MVVIDWFKVGIRGKYNDNLLLFIQIMREINFLIITKTKMNLNLKFKFSIFKDEYGDNKTSKKINKRG